MKRKKVTLTVLKIESFVTSLANKDVNTLKGGTLAPVATVKKQTLIMDQTYDTNCGWTGPLLC